MATISNVEAEARSLVDANTVSFTAATMLRRINKAYEEIVMLIQGCDGQWQFDDNSYTDFPEATTTLVNSQKDYTFDSTMLEIERVTVKDNGGIWHDVTPIDISRIPEPPDEYFKTDGLPLHYDKSGSSLLLYPAPDNGVSVTLTNGLKVFFKRTASLFTSAQQTTGTREPGFASPFHYLLAYKAALPFAAAFKKDRVAFILSEIQRMEKDLIKHYSRREQDRRKVLHMGNISHR